MASAKHLAILKSGVAGWNRWRAASPNMPLDLTQPDLRDANFNEADLRWANLSGVDLSGSDLTRADLRGANLQMAKLLRLSLIRADLTDADLSGADLRDACLVGTILRRTRLSGADLRGVSGLTQQQIDEAWGTEYTKLPRVESLSRPEDWPAEREVQRSRLWSAISCLISFFFGKGL